MLSETLSTAISTVTDPAWILQDLLIAVSWVLLCMDRKTLREKPGKLLKPVLCLTLLFFIVSSVTFAIILTKFLAQMGIFNPFTLCWTVEEGIITWLYLKRFSSYKHQTDIVIWCSMFAGTCCLERIAGQVSYLIGLFLVKGFAEGAARCLIFACGIPLALYLKRFDLDAYPSVPKSGIGLIIAGDICILAMSVAESLWSGYDYRTITVALTAFAGMLAVVLAAIQSIDTMCREQESIISLQAEKQRYESEKELASFTETNLENMHRVRHDLKNQYSCLQILLQEKDYDGLEKYFQEMLDSIPSLYRSVDCGNRSMNTVINMELEKAKKKNVTVETQLIVPPALPFRADDLLSILANMMDNAIEECVRLKESEGKDYPVKISIYPQKGYLLLICRNHTSLHELRRNKEGLQTVKEDGRIHGYGTQIVARLAEKYNGLAEYSLDGEEFVAKVMLDMGTGEGKT